MVYLERKRVDDLLHQNHYRPRELAELLGTSLEFINHEVSTRRLKARRFGNRTVDIPREAVLEWMTARERSWKRESELFGPTQHP
jgi:excisionase family DNA binding protein